MPSVESHHRFAAGSSGKGATKMKTKLSNLHCGFAAVVGIAVLTVASSRGWGAGESPNGVTHLRVTGQVILRGVTRLGINLGEQNYYDSGQMMKNLLFRNPGFEGMSYRSILHCNMGGPARCVDTQQGFVWPAGFWDGAGFEVLDGAAAGRKGKVLTSGPSGGGYGLALDSGKTAIGSGDWLAVQKDFPGDAAVGWWPRLEGGARLETERRDISPASPGHQALRVEATAPGQLAEVNSYFDSSDGLTFVRLHGQYRLSFRAKGLDGSHTLHVYVARLANGLPPYLNQDVKLTSSWADYHVEFAVNEAATGPAATVKVSFGVMGGSVLLDDTALEQADGDPGNQTAFRDEVVQTLKELHPGVLRLMESGEGLGSTVENLLAPPFARQRSGYTIWTSKEEDVAVGFRSFWICARRWAPNPGS